ncbi:hypothetical protein ACPA54_07465 [Uniformispora flossi]|uniref:hypothetical protein n=1 Tax=Uniformispora flossi TaxID=3390723 RepID=UPI003C2F9276
MPVPDRRPSRIAAVWAGIAFGLAGTPFLLVGCVLVYLAAPATAVLLSGVAFGLLLWPLFARTNRELVIAELVSGTILGSATLAVGMCIPFVGVLILVPFLPAICAAVTATVIAAEALVVDNDAAAW